MTAYRRRFRALEGLKLAGWSPPRRRRPRTRTPDPWRSVEPEQISAPSMYKRTSERPLCWLLGGRDDPSAGRRCRDRRPAFCMELAPRPLGDQSREPEGASIIHAKHLRLTTG